MVACAALSKPRSQMHNVYVWRANMDSAAFFIAFCETLGMKVTPSLGVMTCPKLLSGWDLL